MFSHNLNKRKQLNIPFKNYIKFNHYFVKNSINRIINLYSPIPGVQTCFYVALQHATRNTQHATRTRTRTT